MRTALTSIARVLCVVLASACSDEPTLVCPQPILPGLTLEARDSLSGASVASARAVVTDGAYADSLVLPGPAAEDRGGTYAVRIDAPGYRAWRRDGIAVQEDRCGDPVTVNIVARLQRAP